MISQSGRISKSLCAGFSLMAILIAVCSFFLHRASADITLFELIDRANPTVLLDCHGNEWTRFALDKRKEIHIDLLPKHLIQAFLAAEDWHFYSHCGLSIRGIIRSLVTNLYHLRIKQGASTITQQLVRLLFFDHSKTLARKIKEQCMALLVELKFSKDQILQCYLNRVYFSCGIYGVEAAAQRFWSKSAAEVTIGEAAALAGIMRSPATYSPLLHIDATERRRNVVLGQMLHLGFITQQQYTEAVATPLTLAFHAESPTIAPHAREVVRRRAEKILGQSLYTGGYTIKTTLDLSMQANAEAAFLNHISQICKTINPAIDGGLLAIETHSGAIKALVGGKDFYVSKFNRALQARRQLGSVFKPLIFAVALQKGIHFYDVEIDEPMEFFDAHGQSWRPQNYDRRFNGPITLAYALSRSNNIAIIKTFLKIGADEVVKLAQNAGIEGPFHNYPSLALGSIDTTLKEAVGMFNVFANHGLYVEPYIIDRIKNAWGKVLYTHAPTSKTVLSSRISGQILKVLSLGLDRVRKHMPHALVESEIAGKTGTTNEHRTCWFLGSTPELTTGVCIGCDDNQPIGPNVYPIHTAFPIWASFYRQLNMHNKKFDYDPSLKEIYIHSKSGKPVAAEHPSALKIFI